MNNISDKSTATFAMGCFWSPDGLFGSLSGVIRTRVGYTGGSIENPTYRNLGDHIESIEIEYDPEQLSFNDLLSVFWEHHSPTYEPYKRQYASAIFYRSLTQKELCFKRKVQEEQSKGMKIFTEILPYTKFYLAEDYHQKYKLRRNPELMNEFKILFPNEPDFINSTLAARVNGLLNKYGTLENVRIQLKKLGDAPEPVKKLEQLLTKSMRTNGISCI